MITQLWSVWCCGSWSWLGMWGWTWLGPLGLEARGCPASGATVSWRQNAPKNVEDERILGFYCAITASHVHRITDVTNNILDNTHCSQKRRSIPLLHLFIEYEVTSKEIVLKNSSSKSESSVIICSPSCKWTVGWSIKPQKARDPKLNWKDVI